MGEAHDQKVMVDFQSFLVDDYNGVDDDHAILH